MFFSQITKSKDLCDSNFQNFGHLIGTPNLEKSITNLTSNVTEAYCLCLKDKWSDELNDVVTAAGVNKQKQSVDTDNLLFTLSLCQISHMCSQPIHLTHELILCMQSWVNFFVAYNDIESEAVVDL